MKSELIRDADEKSYILKVFAPTDQTGLLYTIDFTGYEKVGGHYHLTRSNMDNYLLSYVISGSINVIYNNKFYHHDKDCLLFFDCITPHEVWTDNEGCELIFIHINNQTLSTFFKQVYSITGPVIPLNNDEINIQKSILEIHNIIKTNYNEKEISQIIYRILTNLKEKLDKEFVALPPIPEYINTIINYISNNYQKRMTLKEYGKLVNITPNHLDFAFKKYTGNSLGEYIANFRFRKAMTLLKNSKKNLNEIAQEVGLEDSQNLIRLFKKSLGMTPTVFRKEDKKNSYF